MSTLLCFWTYWVCNHFPFGEGVSATVLGHLTFLHILVTLHVTINDGNFKQMVDTKFHLYVYNGIPQFCFIKDTSKSML